MRQGLCNDTVSVRPSVSLSVTAVDSGFAAERREGDSGGRLPAAAAAPQHWLQHWLQHGAP